MREIGVGKGRRKDAIGAAKGGRSVKCAAANFAPI